MSQITKNGEYTIDVKLTGGSGKAQIKSPAKLTVRDGEMKARIEWSSPSYDRMEIGDTEYYPINDGGNSQFEIYVPALDEEIPLRAETVAMSEPHMIDYSLYFDSVTAEAAHGGVSFFAVGAIAAAAAVLAAILERRHRSKNG